MDVVQCLTRTHARAYFFFFFCPCFVLVFHLFLFCSCLVFSSIFMSSFSVLQVKKSPKVEVNATEGLRLTTEVKSDDLDGKGSDDGSNSSGSTTSRRSSKRMSRKKGSFDPSALEKASAAASGGQLSPDKAGKAGCSVM